MNNLFQQALHSRNGLVRKGTAMLLQAPKRLSHRLARPTAYEALPPVLANSFPKSGTHLLDQIVSVLPGRRNYGAFLSSMTSSFRFSRRTPGECCRILGASLPGEVVRAHLFYDEDVSRKLQELHFVHYFIYRDPRDVALSEAHYYRSINRWHRLHPLFRDAASIADAIMIAIKGFEEPSGRIYYPDIGARFRHYEAWIDSPDALSVRFEDLISERREDAIRSMMQHYIHKSQGGGDVDQLCRRAIENITPEKSHTFRKGERGGWRDAFSDEHRAAFKELAGAVLIERGYETDNNW